MDWKEKIKEMLETKTGRKQAIHQELFALTEELKNFMPIRVELNAASDGSSSWQVKIGASTFTIDEKEVNDAQIGKLLKDALQELLVKKTEQNLK